MKPGDTVALVGPSGGGKTTLCSLIPRFYDVTDGTISIDGKDIKSLKLKSLRSNIGVVQQDIYLFSGTVYENIEYGRPGATKAEIMEAAKLAGAHDFIMDLEDGYDTYVGERGSKALRRTEAARRHCPGVFKEPADFDFRRGDLRLR